MTDAVVAGRIQFAFTVRYLCVKAEDALQERAHRLARFLWYPTVVLAVALTAATFAVRPELIGRFRTAPLLLAVPAVAAACLALMRRAHQRREHLKNFVCSAGVIFALLASTAIGSYPLLIPSRPDPARSLTVDNAAATATTLVPALVWFIPGLCLLAVYQVVVYRVFAGKVALGSGAHY